MLKIGGSLSLILMIRSLVGSKWNSSKGIALMLTISVAFFIILLSTGKQIDWIISLMGISVSYHIILIAIIIKRYMADKQKEELK